MEAFHRGYRIEQTNEREFLINNQGMLHILVCHKFLIKKDKTIILSYI